MVVVAMVQTVLILYLAPLLLLVVVEEQEMVWALAQMAVQEAADHLALAVLETHQ